MSEAARERRRDRTLGSILAAARAIVAESGPDKLSLREVARRADYSPAALYRYFGGRDDLINALGTEAVTALGRYLQEAPRASSPCERLVALGEAYVRFAEECPQQFVLLDRLRVASQPWERYLTVAFPFTLVVAAFEEAAAEGAIAVADPSIAALGMWSLAHGLASLRAGHLRDVDLDFTGAARSALDAHVRGLQTGAAR